MKGATQYDDAAKDAWRGWKWNTIASAATGWLDLPPKERARRLSDKTVLYLVGPDDHDRKRAMARGFRNENLIAVDLVQERIDEVRAAGGFGIRGSLQQLIMNWPEDWPIDVVDGDFCSGLTNDITSLPWCFIMSPSIQRDTIVSLNMMRGRDAQSNWLRDLICELTKHHTDRHDAESQMKHRAANWSHLLFDIEFKMSIHFGYHTARSENSMDTRTREMVNEWNPKANSYKSKTSGQFFDSIVHRWGSVFEYVSCSFGVCKNGGCRRKHVWNEMAKTVCKLLSRTAAKDDGIRQRIAALRAVRTMKSRELQAS